MRSASLSTKIWIAIACAGVVAACAPQPPVSPTQTPVSQTIWPQLQFIEPAPAVIGEEVLVVGSGGYLQFEVEGATGYDERFRTFMLYLDDELVGEIGCFTNRCEAEFVIPVNLGAGEHVLSAEGGSFLEITVVEP